MRFKRPVCPYCDTELSFSEAFKNKTNEGYLCKKCNNISRVQIDPKIRKLAMSLIIISAIVAIIFSLFIREYLLGTLIILLLFIAFYLQVPHYMKLIGGDEKDLK